MTSDATAIPDDLVRAAMAGDRSAVARLLGTVRPLVIRYCRARLGSDPSLSADDVAQDVCIAVLTALPRYRFERKPFLAFVYGIAAYKVIDAHRASTRVRWDLEVEIPPGRPFTRLLETHYSSDAGVLGHSVIDVDDGLVQLEVFRRETR